MCMLLTWIRKLRSEFIQITSPMNAKILLQAFGADAVEECKLMRPLKQDMGTLRY